MTGTVAVVVGFLGRARRGRDGGPSGGGGLRVLWARLRHGPCAWAAMASAAVILLLAWLLLHTWPWPGDWIETGTILSTGLAFALPIAVGAACWQGGVEARAGVRWIQAHSGRASSTHALLACAPSVLWPLAGFTVAALLLLGTTWLTATGGAPPHQQVAYCVAVLVSHSVVAHVVGTLLPLRVVPFLAAAASGFLGPFSAVFDSDYLAWAFLNPVLAPTTRRHFAGPSVPEHSWGLPSLHPAPWKYGFLWPYGLMLCVVVAVAAAALALLTRRWILSLLLCAALVPAASDHPFDDPPLRSETAPIPVRCRGESPAVCVSDDRSAHRPRVNELAAHISRKLAGAQGAPTHFLATSETLDAWCPDTNDPSGWTVEVSLVSDRSNRFVDIADQVSEVSCHGGVGEESDIVSAVSFWLLPAALREADDHDRSTRHLAARLSALPRETRAIWLAGYFDAVRGGTPLPEIPPTPRAPTA